MKKTLLLLTLMSLGMISISCDNDKIPAPDENDISFSKNVQPIFTTNCVACHDGGIPPDLTAGKSYTAIVPAYVTAGDASSSDLYESLVSGYMPPDGKLSDEDINIVKNWINQGAKNN